MAAAVAALGAVDAALVAADAALVAVAAAAFAALLAVKRSAALLALMSRRWLLLQLWLLNRVRPHLHSL